MRFWGSPEFRRHCVFGFGCVVVAHAGIYSGSGPACRYRMQNRSPPSAITPFTMRPSSSCTQNHHGFLISIKGILTTQTVTGHLARHNPLFTCPLSALYLLSTCPLSAYAQRSTNINIRSDLPISVFAALNIASSLPNRDCIICNSPPICSFRLARPHMQAIPLELKQCRNLRPAPNKSHTPEAETIKYDRLRACNYLV